MKRIVYVFAGVLYFSLVACTYRPDCDSPRLYVSFRDFDSSELARIVVKKYEKGTQSMLDSSGIELKKELGGYRYPITAESDWSFQLVKTGRLFQITEIIINDDKGEKRALIGAGELKPCTDGFFYRINEQQYSKGPTSFYGNEAGEIMLAK